MTSWSWAPLLAGTWGLPGPALLVSEADLQAEPADFYALNFTAVAPGFTDVAISDARTLRVEHLEARTVTVFKAAAHEQLPVDAWGLIRPTVATRPGGPDWEVTAQLDTPGPDAQRHLERFQEEVDEHGQVLLITGDLAAYWAQALAGAEPTLEDVATGSDWVAWVPLDTRAAVAAAPPVARSTFRSRIFRRLAR